MTTDQEYKSKVENLKEKIWYMNPQTDEEELEYITLCKAHVVAAKDWIEYRKVNGLPTDMIIVQFGQWTG